MLDCGLVEDPEIKMGTIRDLPAGLSSELSEVVTHGRFVRRVALIGATFCLKFDLKN